MKKKWSGRIIAKGETNKLMSLAYLCPWIGWGWVAETLNSEYGNSRTPESCRKKFEKETRRDKDM